MYNTDIVTSNFIKFYIHERFDIDIRNAGGREGGDESESDRIMN